MMFNENNQLKEIMISERVLSQLDYGTEELLIVVYLLMNYYSCIRGHEWAKTIYTTCELIFVNTVRGEERITRHSKLNVIDSMNSLSKKGLIKIEGETIASWNNLLVINMEELISKNEDKTHHLDLDSYFKLNKLKHREFSICLHLYLILKSYIDNDEKFFGLASMIGQTKLTSTKYYNDTKVNEWITKTTCKKYLAKLVELDMVEQINPSIGELNLNLPYIYCFQDNVVIVEEILEEVVETFEMVRQARMAQGRKGASTWSVKVRERDNHECQICGKTDGILHAHHLNAKHLFPEQSLNVNNGITLCSKCHHSFHSLYGVGSNTKEQFEEFKLKNNK